MHFWRNTFICISLFVSRQSRLSKAYRDEIEGTNSKGGRLLEATFNLIHEPWLTARRRGGELIYIGLSEVLLSAHQFVRLEHSSPLVHYTACY